MMTKKDFIALADYLKHYGAWQDYQLGILAKFCASRNPRFKRERWLDYIAGKCGPNRGKLI